MPQLRVALLEGFTGETVIIRVNGREVFRESGVKTRMQISRAATFDAEVPTGAARVEVEIPERGETARIEVPVAETAHLGISLSRAGKIEHSVQDEPFRYA